MSSSLQEQLVQAGLADEDRLNRSGKSRRRQSGGSGKKGGGKDRRARQPSADGGSGPPAAGARPAGGTAQAKATPAPQRTPTPEEKADRLRQMIRANRIDRAYAGVPYRFTEGSRIREIAVTGTQQGRIARGELAVVSDGERCELVPAKVARRIRGTDPQAILVLNSDRGPHDDTGDDPYADYRVPDDLMW